MLRSIHQVRRSLIAIAISAGWQAPAAAQTSNAALAESLFREGKRLSTEHKFAEACPKFAESYKLDPGLGTLLNLATCHESEGKPASAWAEFSEATSRAKRDGDNERAQLADEHVHALEPKLAYILLSMAPGAAVPGLVIKFDSREISSVALGVRFPVDPGAHRVEVSAPGKQSDEQTVTAPAAASTLAVTLPVLQDATSPAPLAASATPPPAPSAPLAPVPRAPAAEGHSSHTAVVVSAVALGALAIGTGFTGIAYAQKRSSFNSANESGDPSRFDKRDQAQTLGTVNLVLTGGAVVAAGLLVYFLATGASHESPPASAARLELVPVIAANAGGITLRGAL